METEWPDRFTHIEDEVLMQLSRYINLLYIIYFMLTLTIRTLFEAEQESNNNKTLKKVDTSKMEQRFLRLLPVNIHCTIAWDTDDTCIDLHSNLPYPSSLSPNNI